MSPSCVGKVKHTEKEERDQIYKGRAVLLGDNLRYVCSNQAIRGEDLWWERLYSSLASWDESRMVDMYAVMRGYVEETVDFEAAYLQSDWPQQYVYDPLSQKRVLNPEWSPEMECFVVIPEELREFLPDHLKVTNQKRPMWRLMKPGYGHPASGHIWCEKFRHWLLENGWVQVSYLVRDVYSQEANL